MEEYCQEVGWVGRDGLPVRANIYYNSNDVSKAHKNKTEVMRTYVQSKKCKRKIILNYFDHDVANNQHPDNTCSDFHRENCQCENCELVQEMPATEQNESSSQTKCILLRLKRKSGKLT